MADPAAKPRRAPGPGASRALAATLRRHAKPGVVLAAAPPPVAYPVTEGLIATWRALATAPSPAYLAPARMVDGAPRNRDGRLLELRTCATCPRTFWALAASPGPARRCSRACYGAAGGRWRGAA